MNKSEKSTVAYAYDAAGRLTSATYPDGGVVDYGNATAATVARAPAAAPEPAPVAPAPAPVIAQAAAAPAPVPPAGARVVYCTGCGAPRTSGARFCSRCGKPAA